MGAKKCVWGCVHALLLGAGADVCLIFCNKIPKKLDEKKKKKKSLKNVRVRAPHITIFVRCARAGAAQKVRALKVWAKFKLKLTAE